MNFSPEQNTAYQKAALLCSKAEKCTSEIREKLKLWGLSNPDVVPVIEQLVAEKYIDDSRFAQSYAKDKSRLNRWGKQKIAFMLRSKNISPEIIEEALEEIEDEQYGSHLKKLLTDKARGIKAKDAFDKRNKLIRFAMSRGFESGEIFQVLKELGL